MGRNQISEDGTEAIGQRSSADRLGAVKKSAQFHTVSSKPRARQCSRQFNKLKHDIEATEN